jgi:hypothetical protein
MRDEIFNQRVGRGTGDNIPQLGHQFVGPRELASENELERQHGHHVVARMSKIIKNNYYYY